MNNRDIRSIDVGMLRAFSALMRERSVSKAATVLFLSQPAVSALLSKLRHVFDDPLFQRVKSGVEPTARARHLAPQIDKALAQLNSLLTLDDEFDLARSERIFRIFGTVHASLGVMQKLGAEIVRTGSRARVVWDSPRDRPMVELLRRGALDMALVERDTPPVGMECVCVYEGRHVLIGSAAHPAPQAMTAAEFCAHPQIFMGYGNSTLEESIDAAVRRLGLARSPSIAAYSYSQILMLVEQVGFVAVVPESVLTSQPSAVRILDCPFSLPPYRLWACWARESQDDSGAMWLKDLVLGCFR